MNTRFTAAVVISMLAAAWTDTHMAMGIEGIGGYETPETVGGTHKTAIHRNSLVGIEPGPPASNFGGSRPKNPAAMAMVRMRMQKLSPERRQEIAKKAAETRWAGKKPKAPK